MANRLDHSKGTAVTQDGAIRRHKPVPASFTLEYWEDDGWFVGRLKEVPGVFSQGATISELNANIKDAYRMMLV
jgi:hypothetical protein